MADAMRARRYLRVPALVLLLSGSIEVRAQDWARDWSRAANIATAAAEIAIVHHRDGDGGATAAIAWCYQRELPQASKLTPGLEACMAQDILVAKMWTADVLERGEVTRAMAKRIFGILSKFGIPEQDARAFNDIVQMRGVNAYWRALSPKEFLKSK